MANDTGIYATIKKHTHREKDTPKNFADADDAWHLIGIIKAVFFPN